MTIRNKIKIDFHLEDGCDQEKGETYTQWEPLNFSIYNPLFYDLIGEAIDSWLDENTIAKNYRYEVIFSHVIEMDGAGAVTSEYFEQIHQESQSY